MPDIIIAEKPSVAEDIAKALGGFRKVDGVHVRDDLVISNAFGHLVTIECPEAATVPRGLAGLPLLPPQFSLQVIEKSASQFQKLRKLINDANVGCVYNACDAGREGELIFGLIYEKANCKRPVKRMWMQSMTADSIRNAFDTASPGEEKAALLDAARSRSEADWLIGINSSRALSDLWSKLSGGYEQTNSGRVQTPTLALVVDRENAIQSFVSQPYWEIVGTFAAQAGVYQGKLVVPEQLLSKAADHTGESEEEGASGKFRFASADSAKEMLQMLTGKAVSNVEEQTSDVASKPPLLFDLTSLQQECNRRFKFSAKKTLEIAQSLYERHKMTTYPRTDSCALPEDFVSNARGVVEMLQGSPWSTYAKAICDGDWVVPKKRIFDNSKISDHFAIIPTGSVSSSLSEDEKKVYELIVRRFLAAFYPDAQKQTTKRKTYIEGVEFFSSGTVIVDPGWMSVLREVDAKGQLKTSGKELCALARGEYPTVQELKGTQGKTTPPSRYTVATLLGAMASAGSELEDEEMRAAMKDKGLGTPATRAAIIEGLLSTGNPAKPREPYMRSQENFYHPSPKGMDLVAFLRANGISFLSSASITGEWEEKLIRMSQGEYDRSTFMSEIHQVTAQMVEQVRSESKKVVTASTNLGVTCPKCKQGNILGYKSTFGCSRADGEPGVPGCDFKLFRSFIGHSLTDGEVVAIFSGKSVGPFADFFSAAKKKKFTAAIKLGEGKLELFFPEGPSMKCKCPLCDGDVVAQPMVAKCKECDFVVFRTVCGRKLKDSELETLISTGKLTTPMDFVSPKTKKKFQAGIRIDKQGKSEFIFAPRN